MATNIVPRISATRKTPVPTCPASRAAAAEEAHRELHCVSGPDLSEVNALVEQVRAVMGFDFAADLEEAITAAAAEAVNLAAAYVRVFRVH